MPRWVRDLVLLPLGVGLVFAVVTLVLPKFFRETKELSYSVDGPTAYLDENVSRMVNLEINDNKVPNIVGYRVILSNSGDHPLRDIGVTMAFKANDQNFEIFNVAHNTIPRLEFGKITEEKIDTVSRRFVYSLLNPGDQDEMTLIANMPAPLDVFAKSEGMALRRVDVTTERRWWWEYLFSSVMAAIAGFLIAAITTFFQGLFHRAMPARSPERTTK